jgi:hypothetical protein
MEDSMKYLNSLQVSKYVDDLRNMQSEMGLEKKEEEKSTGALLTSEGSREAIMSAVKNFAVDKGKEVARDALTKAGVDKDVVDNVLKGDPTDIKSKVQDLLSQAKTKVDEVKTQAQELVDNSKSTIAENVTTLQEAGEEGLGQIQGLVSGGEEGLSSLSETLSGGLSRLSSLASGSIRNVIGSSSEALESPSMVSSLVQKLGENRLQSLLGSEFEDVGETGGLMEAPRMISSFGGIRPPKVEVPEFEDEGTMGDLLEAPRMLSNFGSFRPTAMPSAEGLSEGLQQASETAEQAVSGVVSKISGAVSDVGETVSSGLSQAVSSASQLASSAISEATATASKLASGVAGAGEEALGAVAGVAGAEGGIELGPIGIALGGLIGGIVSLEEAKKRVNLAPQLNPSFQFL